MLQQMQAYVIKCSGISRVISCQGDRMTARQSFSAGECIQRIGQITSKIKSAAQSLPWHALQARQRGRGERVKRGGGNREGRGRGRGERKTR